MNRIRVEQPIRFKEFKDFIEEKLRSNLDATLYYHGYHHTLYVLDVMEDIADGEKLDAHDMLLLKTAILLHDSGFLETYRDHEEKGCEYSRRWLPEYGYSEEDIERICGMIMATKIPQTPTNREEYIIADADLEYLGTEKYDEISDTLYKELVAKDIIKSEKQWLDIQIGFLSNHQYWTKFCQDHREAEKKKHLERLKLQVDGHEEPK